jgi:O-antigen chain-terminating methyltransferase
MIQSLVEKLPEVYQPIYGHPELDHKPSRACKDRLKQITHVYKTLESTLKRPLKVLDLGCAQGYFSLNLAKLGAEVDGIDNIHENIAVCNALANKYEDYKIKFEMANIEDKLLHLSHQEYDLVLGLSVFHHIIYQHGSQSVKKLLDNITNQCGSLLVELALNAEPLYWAQSQPNSTNDLLQSIGFTRELSRHKTHLSEIERPLIFCSNQFILLENSALKIIKHQTKLDESETNTYQSTRHYYTGKDFFAKKLDFETDLAEANLVDFKNTKQFLLSAPESFNAPKLLFCEDNKKFAILVMERIEGPSLLQAIQSNPDIDIKSVTLDVLTQLKILSEHKLYHSDLRTWNIIIDAKGHARIIDFGSISSIQKDCVKPYNLFLSFFNLFIELATGNAAKPEDSRSFYTSLPAIPEPYRKWAIHCWEQPISKLSFDYLYVSLNSLNTQEEQSSSNLWQIALMEADSHIKINSEKRIQELEKEKDSLIEKINQDQIEILCIKRMLHDTLNSKLWRLVKPLRAASKLAKKTLAKLKK